VIGGGCLLDTAAFAAALLNASVTLVPTTLLAMVDASLGGKTGVNFPPFGKNQVGLFQNPSRIEIWHSWLETLPGDLLRAQASECLKHAWLRGDRALLDSVTQAITHPQQGRAWQSLLAPLSRVKLEIIDEDPSEDAKRRVLNLGHTLGHALETRSLELSSPEQALHHGEAVALGLSFALELSKAYAGLPEKSYQRLRESLLQSGVMPSAKRLEAALGQSCLGPLHADERLWQLLAQDKKRQSAMTDWVLMKDFGMPHEGSVAGKWTVALTREEVVRVWSRSQEYP
jgi:3-dehydroquinate synthase